VSWTSLRIHPGSAREQVLSALFAAGAQGVHEDGEDLVTHFPASIDVEAVVSAVHAADPSATCNLGRSEDTDWSVAWRDRLGRHDLGGISIVPPWLAEGSDSAPTVIIEPAMAFGTGDHPTTRGAARMLVRQMSSGLVVADLGAGSAVLSIAAAKLGASRVFAIEYDGDAIANAELNVHANGVESVVHVFEGDAGMLLPLVAPVDLIVANIISSVLVELLPAMRRSLREGGRAILAGILAEERSAMEEALAGDGWHIIDQDEEDVWWSVTAATDPPRS
jgi:ribosomal protein L11 methyltransferase